MNSQEGLFLIKQLPVYRVTLRGEIVNVAKMNLGVWKISIIYYTNSIRLRSI